MYRFNKYIELYIELSQTLVTLSTFSLFHMDRHGSGTRRSLITVAEKTDTSHYGTLNRPRAL